MVLGSGWGWLCSHSAGMAAVGSWVWAEGREKQENHARDEVGLSLDLAERRCEPKTLCVSTPGHGGSQEQGRDNHRIREHPDLDGSHQEH